MPLSFIETENVLPKCYNLSYFKVFISTTLIKYLVPHGEILYCDKRKKILGRKRSTKYTYIAYKVNSYVELASQTFYLVATHWQQRSYVYNFAFARKNNVVLKFLKNVPEIVF